MPPRTIYSPEHARLIELLRHYRSRAGLRQVDLAQRLGRTQSYVSNYEVGQRRLDLIELSAVCDALDISVVTLVRRWDELRHITNT